MDIKIVKNSEDNYSFYHGTDSIGVADYDYEKQNFMFSQSRSFTVNQSLLMSIVIVLRDMDQMRKGVKEYITTSTQIMREIGIKDKLERLNRKKAKAKRRKKTKREVSK